MIVPAGLAFTNFVIVAIVIAALYFAREILVPIALAWIAFGAALSALGFALGVRLHLLWGQ